MKSANQNAEKKSDHMSEFKKEILRKMKKKGKNGPKFIKIMTITLYKRSLLADCHFFY